MNIVTPQTPLAEIKEHLTRDGYCVMENALSTQQLGSLNRAYDQLVEQGRKEPGGDVRIQNGWFEIKRLIEKAPEFEMLMDNPPVFAAAHSILGYDIELATGGELDLRSGHSGAHVSWHSDFQWMANVPLPRQNYWIRAAYMLGDVTEEMGPFTLIPGTHQKDTLCPQDWIDENGRPLEQEGMMRVTGKAGSCLLCNTEIWHTATPNITDIDRRLIMILYKHAWMKPWQSGYDISREFAERQTDPLRRQLCGLTEWHQSAKHFAGASYSPES